MADLISISVGRLCVEIDRIYVLLNYMTDDNLFTHQLPRALKACSPVLKEQYPFLTTINSEEWSTENWQSKLADQIKLHGDEFEIEPLAPGLWKSVDPIKEAVELMEDKNRVIAVTI